MKYLDIQLLRNKKEVSEEKYYEMLECLPPEIMLSNAFLVGEPFDHNEMGKPRYDLYYMNGGRYYSGGLFSLRELEIMTLDSDRKCVICGTALMVNDDLKHGWHELE